MLYIITVSSSPSLQNVGFTASRHTGSSVHENGIIIFETTITNAGSAYNPASGIFQVPVSGLYVFFYDIECSKNNGDTSVELVRDGARTGVQAYCHGLGDYDNSSTMGFCTLVLETRSGLDCTMWTTERLEEKRSFLGFYFEAKILTMNRSDDKNLYLVLLKNLLSDSGFWFLKI